ncbi:3-deoxy-manno-octulosonate cytidylyltransferase (CMP-KDO synthetase) [Pseudidiomarina indica]|uniref:3-deoxy-manno-octulosonate cytidylyltransferase n=1 Tax=Pseudidiomarina indica TaxID=1159017 RepID=A0A1G6AS55_9GAMM|nr:3-deoxy-manno-octulosonate cytidylyltransferase [Pseudidiomarina indica]SDB11023.1 3-deoxy-manno-octulosonate cytidylyltransferase (CMP-KDO synthetase) [Pseudidiomarina indica]
MNYTVIIPARYASQRLPGKPLAMIGTKPMIQRVYERALAAGARAVIVATDDPRIVTAVHEFGGQAMLTSADHQSGTERLAEVIEQLQLADDEVVVNVQGDEPFIPPAIIRQVAENLASQQQAGMATLAVPLTELAEILSPHAVKVVTDQQGYALYFSRAPIPYERDGMAENRLGALANYQRHIGIYAYRAGFIRRYVEWPASPLEHIESLEQLRVLWHGEKIHVATALEAPPAGVDTPADLARANQAVTD